MFFARRLYADLVTSDGTVVVMHVNWVRIGGVPSGRASVAIHRPDGFTRVMHGTGSPPTPLPDGGFRYVVTRPDGCALTLEHAGPVDWRLPRTSVARQLTWHVSVASAPATFTEDDETLTGTGYADCLEFGTAPRKLGVRSLHRGRVHVPDRAVAFLAAEFADSDFRLVGDWSITGLKLTEVTPFVHAGDTHLRAPFGFLRLEPLQMLHSGGPLDVPNRVVRSAAQALHGPATEARWVSRALPAEGKGPTGIAVHDVLSYGSVSVETPELRPDLRPASTGAGA